MNNNLKTACKWIALMLWMGVIFALSAGTGSQSAAQSMPIALFLAKVIPLPPEVIEVIVREGSHFAEFAVLGALAFIALDDERKKALFPFVSAMIICVLYALSDELHQYFVPGRSCQLLDILLDSAGSVTGSLIAMAIMKKIRLRKNSAR